MGGHLEASRLEPVGSRHEVPYPPPRARVRGVWDTGEGRVKIQVRVRVEGVGEGCG